MSEPLQRLEERFFEAPTEVVAARADAFSDLDPARRPGRSELRVLALALAGGVVLVGAFTWLAPREGPVQESASAAAATAPARSVRAPIAGHPMQSERLASALGVQAAGPTSGPAPAPVSAAAASAEVDDGLSAARARLEAGDHQGALSLAQAAPPGVAAQVVQGRALYELGRDAEALKVLREALTQVPEHEEALLLLGSVLQESDPTDAARTYRRYLAAHPNGPEAVEVQRILERLEAS